MRGSKSIFQTVRATRIFRHVPTNAANRLRRRIGRIKISLRRDAIGDIEIYYTGLHSYAGIRKIHFQDFVHAGEADYDSVFYGESAAAEPGAGAAGYEGNFFAVADADNFLDLLGGIREQDRAWEHAKIGQAIALIGVQLFAGSDQSARADDFAQFVENPAINNARGRILRFRSARFGVALVHSAGGHGCLSGTAGLLP